MKIRCTHCRCKDKVTAYTANNPPLPLKGDKPPNWWQTPLQLAAGPTEPDIPKNSWWSEFIWQVCFLLMLAGLDALFITSTIAYAGGAEVKAPRGKNLTPEQLESIPGIVAFGSIFITVVLVFQAVQVWHHWNKRKTWNQS